MANPSRGSPSSVQLGQAPNNGYQSRFDPVRGSYEEPISSYHGAWTEAPPEPQSLPPTSVEEKRFQTLEGMALTLENKMDKFEQKLDELIREFNLPQIPPAMAPPHPPPPDPYGYHQPYTLPPQPQISPPVPQYQQPYTPPPSLPSPHHYMSSTWNPQPSPYYSPPLQYTTATLSWYHQQSHISLPTCLQQQYQYAPYVFDEIPVKKEAVGVTYACEDIVGVPTDKGVVDHVEGMQLKFDNGCDSLEGGDCKASSADENPVIFVETVRDSVSIAVEELSASHWENTFPKQVEISFGPANFLLQDFTVEVYRESDSDFDSPKKMSQIAVEVEVESRPQPEDLVAKDDKVEVKIDNRSEGSRSVTFCRYNKIHFQNKELLDGSWMDQVIWDPGIPYPMSESESKLLIQSIPQKSRLSYASGHGYPMLQSSSDVNHGNGQLKVNGGVTNIASLKLSVQIGEMCWMFEDEGGMKHGPHSLEELLYWHQSSCLQDTLMIYHVDSKFGLFTEATLADIWSTDMRLDIVEEDINGDDVVMDFPCCLGTGERVWDPGIFSTYSNTYFPGPCFYNLTARTIGISCFLSTTLTSVLTSITRVSICHDTALNSSYINVSMNSKEEYQIARESIRTTGDSWEDK